MSKRYKGTLEYIMIILITLILSLYIRTNIVSGARVVGESMSPTLQEKDLLIIIRLGLEGKIERGDIVCVDGLDGQEDTFIKRVIGLPGEKVEISGGNIYINNKKIDEEYTESYTYPFDMGSDTWELYEEEFFVLGDNREHSLDSRIFGKITQDNITGKYTYKIKGSK